MSTLKDVAERAGVTVTTVSRVINNRGYISEKTRKRVYDAMREIGYRPNEVARSLSRKNTNTIGVITPRIDHPYYSKLVSEIEAEAAAEKCKIILCCTNNDAKQTRGFIEMFRADQALGTILCGCLPETDGEKELEFPVVMIGDAGGTVQCVVQCDNYEGGALAAEALINKGCRRLMYIGRDWKKDGITDMKRSGFVDRCDRSGAAYSMITVHEEMHCAEHILAALREESDVDGIFAGGDLIAAEALKACAASGRKVPGDIKIIGFGDTDVASLTIPLLSSVRQPVKEMARLSVQNILKKRRGEVVPSRMVLPVRVVERETMA